jgi:uncharacterized protein YbjT (DUF2867 family)
VPFALEDTTTYAQAVEGCDAVFLMRPPQITKARVFQPFLNYLQKRGIRRVVFLSVLGADSNKVLPHHGMEQLIMQLDFDWTMIRPSDFMQNLETVHRESIRENHEIAVPAGRGASSFIDVGDIADVIKLALEDEAYVHKGLDLTGAVALDFYQVADQMSEVLGHKIIYRPVSPIPFFFKKVGEGNNLGLSFVMTALYLVQAMNKANTVTPMVAKLLGRAPTSLWTYLQANKDKWV